MKQRIRLTESYLHRIVKESVSKILREDKEKKIKLQYLVKKPEISMYGDCNYEVKELVHICDPNKSDRENLDDAFSKACELGANPNKNIRWKFI